MVEFSMFFFRKYFLIFKANKIFLKSIGFGFKEYLSVNITINLAFVIAALSKSFSFIGFPSKYFTFISYFPA